MSHPADPLDRFLAAFARAQAEETIDATAAALATADRSGRPSVRYVLCKTADGSGLRFFTNFESRKARDIAQNPRASLVFLWPKLEEQVRVEGPVEALDDATADAYFASRPRLSQIGAWASFQSRPLGSREELDMRVAEIDARFAERDVPRPPHWGGYRLIPDRWEFWKQGHSRLHDRWLYTLDDSAWRMTLLYP